MPLQIVRNDITKMKTLQSELLDLLVAEEKSKADLLTGFKERGYEIEL